MAGFTEIPRTTHIIEAHPERRRERPRRKGAGRQRHRDRLVTLLIIAALLVALYLALGLGKRRAAQAADAARVIESFERGRAARGNVVTPAMQRRAEQEQGDATN
jgi:hypothetical protein